MNIELQQTCWVLAGALVLVLCMLWYHLRDEHYTLAELSRLDLLCFGSALDYEDFISKFEPELAGRLMGLYRSGRVNVLDLWRVLPPQDKKVLEQELQRRRSILA